MKFKVLSIDAWAGSEEGSWEWNNWFDAGSIEMIDLNDDKKVLDSLIELGYLKSTARELAEIEDDGFNLVVVSKESREPLYAIEYGCRA